MAKQRRTRTMSGKGASVAVAAAQEKLYSTKTLEAAAVLSELPSAAVDQAVARAGALRKEGATKATKTAAAPSSGTKKQKTKRTSNTARISTGGKGVAKPGRPAKGAKKAPKKKAEWEVERVMGTKKEKGKTFWLVRWKGFGPEDDTWEPSQNMDNAQLAIKDFLKKY